MHNKIQNASTRHILTVLLFCIAWYVISSSNNVIGKMVLNEFPFPMTVTMVQLCSIALYSGPFFNLWRIRKYQNISRGYYWRLIIPLALGKFLASVTSHISLWKVPVSYAHTVKATMPLFTVILTRLLFREKQPTLVYLSLVPIITGVAIATLTEISFDMVGLISALISTMGFSLQNIFSKKVLKDTGMHHLRLLHLLGKLALFMFLPIWVFVDSFKVIQHPAITGFDYRVIALLFTDGVLNWLQNVIAFNVLHLVTPLTYAVASASKRIFVIAVSLFILGNPVTWLNCAGMTMAIFGVLCYNRAKQVTRASETILPLTQNHRIKYEPLKGNLDPYYQGAMTSNPNGFASKRAEKQYTNLNPVPTNSLLSNGNVFPNGSTMTTTRLLFV
ncbi:solute carrier family 35 member E1 homolog isoform X1 [Ceratitis capitata]|uniref:solute carrier family 35 member E1 homolog isoform X1 n=2 Tax=Ceratitis capitata TaxID=7213 RepID=UPI000329B808|nr:solute carrier family 35 member E1 homolog isoform X1 [Ceratitis capitata]